jgi:hypothetical protein
VKLEDIRIVGEPLVLSTLADVDGLESRLWIAFPEGYRDYVTQLGEGVLGGSFIRIYPPWRIENELVEWRRRINKYWFWDEGRHVLPKERALECVLIGDTLGGDEIVFHPARPNRLFVLPRYSEQVFDAGDDLLSAIEWMCSSGQLVEQFLERDFEPFDGRKEAADTQTATAAGGVADPEGESLDDLVSLGKRWAERHSARKMAEQALEKHVGVDRTSKLLWEATVLEGRQFQPGYLAVFGINDKDTGLQVATFSWNWNDDPNASGSGMFTPNQANLAKLGKLK